MMDNMLKGMFGKLQNGMCKLSMNGGIAVKTSNGYKTYNLKTNRLTNCSNFVFSGFEDFFFVIPTNKVVKGDIIIVFGTPRAVVKVENGTITAINYETGVIENILPERHVFMGNTYFYGKIVSMFGGDLLKGKKGANKVMQYMMLSEMMKGNTGNSSSASTAGFGGMNSIVPLMLMSNSGVGNMFSGIFDDTDEEDNENLITKLMEQDEEESEEE